MQPKSGTTATPALVQSDSVRREIGREPHLGSQIAAVGFGFTLRARLTKMIFERGLKTCGTISGRSLPFPAVVFGARMIRGVGSLTL
jgi:hypothetical protein